MVLSICSYMPTYADGQIKLPKNHSSFRQSFLDLAITGTDALTVTECAMLFQVSTSMVYNAKGEAKRLEETSRGFTRSLETEKEESFKEWLNGPGGLPVISGRLFRVQTQVMLDHFLDYAQFCLDENRPGYQQAKFYNRMDEERVHKSLGGIGCKSCLRLAELEPLQASEQDSQEMAALERHREALVSQRGQYCEDRVNLKMGQLLVVQDFTNHDKGLHGKSQQDHIVVLYRRDAEGAELTHRIEHYIGGIGTKNDVNFSIHVWILLQTDPWVREADELIIWSDNGPKHFKLTAYLFFMVFWAAVNEKKVSLRFNAPFHGACVADAAAAHLKRRTVRYIATTSSAMNDPMELVRLANTLQNHSARLVDVPQPRKKVTADTYQGMSKLYHWEPDKDYSILAWPTTKSRSNSMAYKRYRAPINHCLGLVIDRKTKLLKQQANDSIVE